MPLAQGMRIGHYEVGAQIGAGGMGEVYRARDAQLGRDVALKVLPDSCVADPERIARLVREAQTLASLNHPNIGAIHGIERTTGVTALVLELVEGPTLADRIAEGPIAIDEALEIAEQVARALEAAHEQGIVHRDVKPSNIKLRPDGTVKVLDFGLAKAFAMDSGELSSDSSSNSPTITTPALSRVGVILGTAAYMSPEQARGRQLDKRTDIWAFGCVLFEMLSGRRAFPGDEVADVLASVLTREPDFTSLPPGVPSQIRRLIDRCLRKDRQSRLRDIGDARLEIRDARENAASGSAPAGFQSSSVRTERLIWLVLLATAVAVTTYAIVHYAGGREARSESRAEIITPATTSGAVAASISPDGTMVAFAAYADGRLRLWVREFAADAPRNLPGTDGAHLPFWSPDSRSIGFFADNWLKRIDLDGGAVQVLAQPFDPDELQLTGKPTTVVTNCQCQSPSVSNTGTITYRRVPSDATRRFIWFDRGGKELQRLDGRVLGSPSLSKDDTRALGYTSNPVDGNVDVWMFDLVRLALTRLTLDVGDDVSPVWSPDEARIAFASNRKNMKHDLYIKPATTAGREEVLLSTPEEKSVDDWSVDGRYVLFDQRSFTRRNDLMAVEVAPPHKVIAVGRTDWEEARGQFSPDGNWVAFQSDASGRPEIHLQPFPGPGKEVVISNGGGTQVRWRRDSTELFYVTLDGRLMAVPLKLFSKQQDTEVGAPIYLFTPPLGGTVQHGDYRHQYDVSADGKRFLVAAASTPQINTPIGVIFNWTRAPRER